MFQFSYISLFRGQKFVDRFFRSIDPCIDVLPWTSPAQPWRHFLDEGKLPTGIWLILAVVGAVPSQADFKVKFVGLEAKKSL